MGLILSLVKYCSSPYTPFFPARFYDQNSANVFFDNSDSYSDSNSYFSNNFNFLIGLLLIFKKMEKYGESNSYFSNNFDFLIRPLLIFKRWRNRVKQGKK